MCSHVNTHKNRSILSLINAQLGNMHTNICNTACHHTFTIWLDIAQLRCVTVVPILLHPHEGFHESVQQS